MEYTGFEILHLGIITLDCDNRIFQSTIAKKKGPGSYKLPSPNLLVSFRTSGSRSTTARIPELTDSAAEIKSTSVTTNVRTGDTIKVRKGKVKGLGVIVQSSTLIFNTIKWVGVIYLILLGIKNWCQSITEVETIDTKLNISLFRQFSLGWATGMSNPKSVLVFTVLFPQFIDPDQYSNHFVILAATFFIIQGSSAFTYALFGAKVFQWMQKRNLARIQNKVTATILFFAGGLLAFSKK